MSYVPEPINGPDTVTERIHADGYVIRDSEGEIIGCSPEVEIVVRFPAGWGARVSSSVAAAADTMTARLMRDET